MVVVVVGGFIVAAVVLICTGSCLTETVSTRTSLGMVVSRWETSCGEAAGVIVGAVVVAVVVRGGVDGFCVAL